MHLTGTLINVATVLAGTILGSVFRGRLPERIRETVIHALGLVTIVVGVDGALVAFRPPLSTTTRASVVIVLGSVLVGGVIGELVGIEGALNALGEALKRRFGRREARFTEGFVVASLVFCVGPLTILGAIHDGLTGDYQLLAIKSVLDGFAALAFASVLGWGVGFSVVTILVYQGGIALGASALRDVFTPTTIAALTAAGGVLILGIGFRLLDLVKVRVANLLPALLLAPVTLAIVDRMH
ncbi:MAG: DUF554 domain-containing protein [Actinomycetota bacterium]|nr:DUF554 domain-containing protein [Actinomycetota bacterium]